MEQDSWFVKEPLLCAVSSPNIAMSGTSSSASHTSHRFVPGELTVKIEQSCRSSITRENFIADKRTLLQDDTSSQTSFKELKEEDLHFQVAYELNDEENETICFDCNK